MAETEIITAHSIGDLVERLLDEMNLKDAAMERLQLLLEAPNWGAQGLITMMFMRQLSQDHTFPTMPSDEHLKDVGIYCAYIILAKQRRSKSRHRTIDYMQEALELFALYEDRPFPMLLQVEKIINAAKRREEATK